MSKKGSGGFATCHPDRPHHVRGLCKFCYYKGDYQRRIAKDPDYPKKRAEYSRQWQLKNKARTKQLARQWHLLTTYNLTEEQFDAMIKNQGGVCVICGSIPKIFAVDHNHQTGAVRKLLCRPCNAGLGQFKEDPNILRKAATYLEEHGT